jgi:ankyrin repeat protein
MVIIKTEKGFLKTVESGNAAAVGDYLAGASEKKALAWVTAQSGPANQTPLHRAAELGHAEVLALLVPFAAKSAGLTTRTDHERSTPLMLAIRSGNPECVKLLLTDKEVQKAGVGVAEVNAAIDTGRLDMLRDLLACGNINLTPAKNVDPPVYHAVKARHADCVKFLLDVGLNPSQVLERQGDDVPENRRHLSNNSGGYYDESPLFVATQNDDRDIVDLLLAKGGTFASLELPLSCATAAGNLPLLEHLLKGASSYELSKTSEPDDWSALHLAVAMNYPDIARALVRKGANPEQASSGLTPLGLAQHRLMTEMIGILRGKTPVSPARIAVTPADKIPEPPRLPPKLPRPTVPAFSITLLPAETEPGEEWKRSGKHRLTHVFEAADRRITEVFNFEQRECLTLTQNPATRSEAVGPHESFDTLPRETLVKAFETYLRLGGEAEESTVFKTAEPKPPPRPPTNTGPR